MINEILVCIKIVAISLLLESLLIYEFFENYQLQVLVLKSNFQSKVCQLRTNFVSNMIDLGLSLAAKSP